MASNLYALQNHASKANVLTRLTSYYIVLPEIDSLTGLLESFFANYTAEGRRLNDPERQQFVSSLEQVIRNPADFDAIEKLKLLLPSLNSE